MRYDQDKDSPISEQELRAEATDQARRIREKEAAKKKEPTPEMVNEPADPATPEIARLLDAARINPADTIAEPPTCLTIEANEAKAIIGTAGNFSVIIGAAKARKSFMTAAIVAAFLNTNQPVMGCLRGHLQIGKPGVLLIDTEQGRFHVLRGVKRICLLSGIDTPEHLHTYALRQYDTRQRIEAIRYVIENTPGIGLVVIDGARDIVFSINSEEEATATASLLLQLTEQYGIHLLTVLHTNKGANADARGHLGAELINKAETVMRVSKDPVDKAVSVVTPEHCRDRDFEPFAFSINEQELPYRIDEVPEASKPAGRTKKSKSSDLKAEEVEAILRRVFANSEQLLYSQLRTGIIEASEHGGVTLAKSKAETLIVRVVTDGYLSKSKSPKQRYDHYQINADKLPSQLS